MIQGPLDDLRDETFLADTDGEAERAGDGQGKRGDAIGEGAERRRGVRFLFRRFSRFGLRFNGAANDAAVLAFPFVESGEGGLQAELLGISGIDT